jgi:hypothetical protein
MRLSLFLTTCLIFLSSFSLADKLLEAKKGDYVVTEQEKNYSLLLIKETNKDSLLFEEISVPSHSIDLSSINWEDWLFLGAPGHTSWIQYEVDPSSLELTECYSVSKRGWLYLEESEHFLSRLLSLKLLRIKKEDRKKIGPSPRFGEMDLRPVWNPPLLSNGKKTKMPSEAWTAYWPKDDSLLSSCKITLYFPPEETSSFPIWIEANNGHFTYSIKAVCFGKDLPSFSAPSIPRRPPKIINVFEKKAGSIIVTLKAPAYYKEFTLYAFDLLKPYEQIGPIPFNLQKGKEKESMLLELSTKHLNQFLQKNHRYKWVLSPQKPASFSVESEDFFLWKP